jgi:hypothetical protein
MYDRRTDNLKPPSPYTAKKYAAALVQRSIVAEKTPNGNKSGVQYGTMYIPKGWGATFEEMKKANKDEKATGPETRNAWIRDRTLDRAALEHLEQTIDKNDRDGWYEQSF